MTDVFIITAWIFILMTKPTKIPSRELVIVIHEKTAPSGLIVHSPLFFSEIIDVDHRQAAILVSNSTINSYDITQK